MVFDKTPNLQARHRKYTRSNAFPCKLCDQCAVMTGSIRLMDKTTQYSSVSIADMRPHTLAEIIRGPRDVWSLFSTLRCDSAPQNLVKLVMYNV